MRARVFKASTAVELTARMDKTKELGRKGTLEVSLEGPKSKRGDRLAVRYNGSGQATADPKING